MKIIKPSFNEIKNENPQKHIEAIARICYKSEDLITDISHKKMITNLYNRKHYAMLEHFIFIYKVNEIIANKLSEEKYIIKTSVPILSNDDKYDIRYVISFSARSLLDILDKIDDVDKELIINLIEQVVYDYNCDEMFGNRFKKVNNPKMFNKVDDVEMLTLYEQYYHGWHSIKFICDRGVSHEIVRHRDASFAQESTRYCNYSKDKFGQEITVIDPLMFNNEAELDSIERKRYDIWKKSINSSENAYFDLLISGATPQEARSVLPNSLKTEVVMTARNYEWEHFFDLRCEKVAHPQMREIAIPTFKYFSNTYDLFNSDNEIINRIKNKIKESKGE